jgi:predicted ATPase
MTEFEADQLINERYQLVREIGAGGMGTVWLAIDRADGEPVALKTLSLHVNETDRRRFEREIRTLQTLEHPHITSFRDLGWVGEQLFFTMDYVEGVTLETVLAACAPVTSRDAWRGLVRLLQPIVSALGHLHGRRLVHRDVKPGNILLTASTLPVPTGEEWLLRDDIAVRLADFGLVKGSDAETHLTQSVLGTPQYMSPEQIEASSAVDGRSDLYSIGVILFRAATGRLPFERLSDVLSRRGMPSIGAGNPVLDAASLDAIGKLLEFEPHRRPIDAEETIELLAGITEATKGETSTIQPGRRAQPTFAGRTAELETLLGATRRAARGEGTWVSITGERGLGKSWLVTRSEFRTRALVSERLEFFSGSFTEATTHGGFASILEGIFRHMERHRGPARIVEAVGRWGRHLGDLFPRLSHAGWLDGCPEITDTAPPEVLKERVLDAVVGALTADAELEPRILFLEDLHHCDEFDLELLRRLLLNALHLPILVITTHRPSLEGGRPALGRLLREIGTEDRLDSVELAPFTLEEVRAMVGSLLIPELPLDDRVVELLGDRADGVPLYTLHLFNSLWAKGLLSPVEGRWVVADEARKLPIPESTRSHFLLALDEIPAAERKVLNLGAVIGRHFSFELLQRVAGTDEFELDELCRALVHAGILEEHQDGFRFQHGFEREIILDQLSGPMRRRLHARVAQNLEALHADDEERNLEQLAEQMYLGGDRERALDYLRRAGDRAVSSYALRRALDFFGKALEIAQEDRDRRTLLARVGDLHLRLGEPDDAMRSFREAIHHYTRIENTLLAEPPAEGAEEREDLRSYAALLVKFGEVYVRARDHGQALEHFEKAERIARFIDDPRQIALTLCRQGAAHAYRENLAEAEAVYRRAVEIHDALPAERGIVIALTGLEYVERMRGHLEQALEISQRALAAAEELGDPSQTATLLSQFGNLQRALGHIPEAQRAYERSLELAGPLGDRRAEAVALMNLGRTSAFLGDFRRSLDCLTRAREMFQMTGDAQGEILSLGNLGTLHFYLGDFRAARALLEDYRESAERKGFRRAIADADHCLGILEHELDHDDDALKRFEASRDEFERAGDEEGVLQSRVQISRVIGRRGDPARALELARQASERAEEVGASEPLAESLRVRAEARRDLGQLEEAQHAAERALALFEQQSQPYAEGVCCRTLAKIYRDRGFEWADRAGRYFERSIGIFERLGARHALAVTRREYATFLLLVEERERARELLRDAVAVFEELGSAGELARARAELDGLEA